MLSFMGKTIIERQIEIYRKCGIDKIIIIRGFAAEKICYGGVTYYTNKAYESTNMVVSLMEAKQEFNDDVVVSYSDILFEEQMLRKMIAAEGDYVVAVDDNWKAYWEKRYGRVDFDTESLSLDNENNIRELGLENPKLSDIDARYVGLLKFSQKGLGYISRIYDDACRDYRDKPWQQSGKTVQKAYMTDLLNAVIESGERIRAERFRNGWIEFDTNEDYERACDWVADNSIYEILKL